MISCYRFLYDIYIHNKNIANVENI